MSNQKTKSVKDSRTEMVQLVLPNDCNQLGTLFGGRLMEWIDIVASITAMKHAQRVCVTVSLDSLNFFLPIRLGEVVILKGSVNRVFRTSMEIGVKVQSENLKTGEVKHANSAYLTFVGIDESAKPVPVLPVVPETSDEIRRWEAALLRRKRRLKLNRRLMSHRLKRDKSKATEATG
jgi:acyl-CoA hydrolase